MIQILEQNIVDNPVDFELEKKSYKPRKKIIQTIVDNVKHYNCNYCGQVKYVEQFNKNINQGCNICCLTRTKEKSNTPLGTLQLLLNHATGSTIYRNEKKDEKDKHLYDIDINYLVELFNKQKGLCVYSNIPLQFGDSYKKMDWKISLERIDVFKGYVKDNVCLICFEFNTTDKTVLYKNIEQDSGNCGWNKEKFDLFKSVLNINY